MTQSELMRAKTGLAAVFCCSCVGLAAQMSDDPVAVFTEHPRLFLRAQRIRLLKRERERASPRWQQLETLVVGGAPMPEPGFAWALYYQVTGNQEYGRKAIVWALTSGADIRQQALVFDWCQDLLTEAQRRDLTARLAKSIADTADSGIPAVRSRTLAAIALYDHAPEAPQRALDATVHQWWERQMVPALRAGKSVVARDDAYALWELLHAVRDNTNLDLRESVPQFFKDFPIEHLLSHYPATYDAAENQYRIGVTLKSGEPDLQVAARSRVVELAMVALDVNAAESQVLQGWLMHDHFMLRGTYGAPYEFLWANPYQPGLSYYHVPLIYHNADFGRLFVRSSWDDDAEWFGYFDGVMQMFSQGHLTPLSAQLQSPPVSLQEAMICFAGGARKFHFTLEEEEAVFILGLEPGRTYQVEIDDEEIFEAGTDRGGILELDMPRGKPVGVRIKEIADAGQDGILRRDGNLVAIPVANLPRMDGRDPYATAVMGSSMDCRTLCMRRSSRVRSAGGTLVTASRVRAVKKSFAASW